MSTNTFIKWWFSWASAMEIDFIQPCFSCGDNIKMLAADGTKIGITLKQASVEPIEERRNNNVVLPTSNLRYDRTFISRSNAKTKSDS